MRFRERTRPERENGYNESFDSKLRDELINREIFYTLWEAKVLAKRWRKEYDQVRPYSSLDYRPPAPETREPPPMDRAVWVLKLYTFRKHAMISRSTLKQFDTCLDPQSLELKIRAQNFP